MKAKLLPVQFSQTQDEVFRERMETLAELFADEVVFLPAIRLGEQPPEADAVVLPVLPAEAYHLADVLKALALPIFVLSGGHGARSMWDWEQVSHLKGQGVALFAPHDITFARVLIRAVALKREMRQAKILAWQGPGQRGYYWYEAECAPRVKDRFGLEIVYADYKDLCSRAKAIPDEAARAVAREKVILKEEVRGGRLLSAIKLYMAMEEQLAQIPGVVGITANCLNESQYTDTSPCLAFALLNRERGLKITCEADTISLLTQYIAETVAGQGSYTTNIYPFLMGQAAVRHEKIADFPLVERPEDHALLVHCGYCGLIPESIANSWVLRPSVLGMLDENAVVIDAQIPEGDVSLVKLHISFDRWLLAPASLEGYARYPGSDCRCGAVIRVRDGYEFMERVYSHHIAVMPGKFVPHLKAAGQLLGLEAEMC